MRHPLALVGLVTVACLSVARPVAGQVDLIVKTGHAGAPATQVLTGFVSKTVGDSARPTPRLLEGVSSVHRLFPQASTAGKTDRFRNVFRLSLPDSAAFLAARARWEGERDVEYAIPNHRYALDFFGRPDEEYNDTHFDSLTHLDLIRAPEAWNTTRGTRSIRIGVIDTGVYKDHPDLQGQFWANPAEDLNGNGILDEADLNGIDDDENGYIDDVVGFDFVDRSRSVDQGDYFNRDPDASEDRLSPLAPRRRGFGHGTLVAGIASAALDNGIGIAGVAPGASLVPLRAFGIDGLAEDDDVAAAIVYATDTGIDVVNLSFGDTYYSPLMADAVAYASSKGTVVVASGGNVGTDEPHYPSDYPQAIGALWLSRDGEQRGSRASFGIGVDVGAPGSFVYTTLMPPPDDLIDDATADSVLYGYRSGSSTSAPQVAGAAALLKSIDPALTPASIKAVLTGTALDLGDPGWDYETAAGRLDIAAALGLPYPAAVSVSHPRHEEGVTGGTIEIVGSAVSSLFSSYSLWFGRQADREEPDWQLIDGPIAEQVRNGRLGVWNTDVLADTSYVLRLEVVLSNGQTIEDRRRVFIDKTDPEITVLAADAALNGELAGIQVEIDVSDLSTATLHVELGGESYAVLTDRQTRRHGHRLAWRDHSRLGGTARIWVEAQNVSGLVSQTEPSTVEIPAMPNPGFLAEQTTAVPAGFLLPSEVDLDVDGLPEIVFNRYQETWLGDTIRVAEWSGDDFRTAANLLANSFPRSTGDTDNDGDPEILLQVSAATQVLEIGGGGTTAEIIFVDTTGISDPDSSGAVWGAALTDLDGDGRGEVVSHNRSEWRLFEYRPEGFELVATLENPTPLEEGQESGLLGSEANGFAEPEALAGDFDGDGWGDLLVTDSDGDIIIFEATGDDTYEASWFYLTPRFTSQGSRLAEGDFDGDGAREFVGYTHGWPDARFDGEYDAQYGVYYFFESTGDNAYAITDSLTVSGEISNHGSMATVDFDADGADELVLAHPPDLYVLKPDPLKRWDIRFHRGDLAAEMVTGIRSISMAPGDFDLNGIPDVVVAGADQFMYRLEWSSEGTLRPPPAWVAAHAIDSASVALSWRRGAADSVSVFRRFLNGTFDLLTSSASEILIDSVASEVLYVLLAHFGNDTSALSEQRSVRPHARYQIQESGWVDETLVFSFDGPLEPNPEAAAIRTSGKLRPSSAQTGRSGLDLILSFDPLPAEGDTVFWSELRDSEGAPVQDRFGIVGARTDAGPGLFLTAWEATGSTTARLEFNLALDPSWAQDLANYRLDPTGTITQALYRSGTPNEVLLEVEGQALGPTGLQSSIVVLDMLAVDGTGLASEGTVATFAASAESLSEAYIFPNPYRATEHGQSIMIAGLPNRSTVEIYSATGTPIRVLEELDGDGGISWDLTDEAGAPVTSGMYVVRVETEDEESVILKSAIIR